MITSEISPSGSDAGHHAAGGKPVVTDGPFTEAKEVLGCCSGGGGRIDQIAG
jgi:hypothetical protein